MNSTLAKATVGLLPVSVLFAYSVAVFAKRRTLPIVLQLVGSACLVVVVLTHVCEAFGLLPAMRFGEPDSAGHYLDLSSAVIGVTLLLVALGLRAIGGRR